MNEPTRKQDVTRKVVVDLKKVEGRVPRNEGGDPAFTWLFPYGSTTLNEHQGKCVLDVFSPEQVVALVNRALYQMMYSREAHKNRAQEQRDREKPVKEMFRKLYPGTSWAQATETQIKHAVIEVMKLQSQKGSE